MKLPMYIAAMKVQNTSGLVANSIGPGSTLCILRPASMIALGAANGMPRVSSGIIEPITALLLADSGPTTPSTAPLPNSPGFFDIFFSSAYETKVEITVHGPGSRPTKKPSTEPRSIGITERPISSLLG